MEEGFIKFNTLKEDFIRTVTALPSPEKPLFLLLDSLDQLNDSDEGRGLMWLIPLVMNLPPHIKVVLSTLPDHSGIFKCLTILRGALDAQSFLQVKRVEEPELVLNHMLNLHRRRYVHKCYAFII
jgi:hypothetical protein